MATTEPDLDEILSLALRDLPQDPVERRRAFEKIIAEAEAEVERDGTVSLDDVIAELEAIIAGKA